ncbi:MAG: peptide ABC transporter substrate-binding protein [Chloroflexi bacterium]|nr:peptide ABC transporter substrate-binding protein [Chloroflexota bacterium]
MSRLPAILFLVLVVGVAACQGTVTPSPPVPTIAPSGDRLSPAPSRPAPGSSAPAPVDPLRSTYAPVAGKDGGTIVIGDWQEANQFHPYFVSEATDARVAAAVWASLVVLTADGGFAPDLATIIPTTANDGVTVPGIDGDAMTVTWTLRDGLLWSDGEPLTCDDFRYAWEWVNNPDNVGVLASGFEDIKTFECPTATTMIWHFNRIYAGYVNLLTAPLPRHSLTAIPLVDQTAGVGFRAAEVPKLPVSGAFKFDSVSPGTDLRLVRNPNYAGGARAKPAHLERLIWRWYPDSAALIAAYRKGDVNLATNIPDTDLAGLKNLGKQVAPIPSLTYELLRPNWSSTRCSRSVQVQDRGPGCPLADLAIRQAIAAAIDRSAINDTLLGGAARIAATNVAPSAWFVADQPPTTFDPGRARSILDAAGWQVGRDGIRRKGGEGLQARIELCTTTDEFRVKSAGLVAGWLQDVGIATVVNAVPAEQMLADDASSACSLASGNFDLAEQSLTSSVDPLGVFFAVHSSQVSPNGSNLASVNDPTIDAALGTVRNSGDLRIIEDALIEYQRVYVEKTVEIPLYHRQNVNLVQPKVGNFAPGSTQAGTTWNAVDWFIK